MAKESEKKKKNNRELEFSQLSSSQLCTLEFETTSVQKQKKIEKI